jgi:hypothetical protein
MAFVFDSSRWHVDVDELELKQGQRRDIYIDTQIYVLVVPLWLL